MAERCGKHKVQVRAGLVTAPSEYRWSSTKAHIKAEGRLLREGRAAVVAGEELATTLSKSA